MHTTDSGNTKGNILLNKIEIRRAITRISHEILEKNQNDLNIALVGIKRRGVPLANRLQNRIVEFEGLDLPTGELDITFYRDDLSKISDTPIVKNNNISFDIDNRTVVIVDDVLYTGRTCRAAINAIFDLGRPKSIQLAILIDRGHRELPIRPDFVGKNIPTSKQEQVLVELEEIDGIDQVILKNNGAY